jgi:hypothetical protein
MNPVLGEGRRTTATSTPSRATAVWFLAALSTLPWLAALEHLATLPTEAAKQDLADGGMWPGLLAAVIVGGIAIGVTLFSSWVLAQRAPHLVAGVLLALALVMGWVVRPLAWRHAPGDVLLILERGKIWVVWLALNLLGTVIVAAVGLLVRRSARMGAT